jgi:hypothetical protein
MYVITKCQNSVVVTITQPANALAATVTEVRLNVVLKCSSSRNSNHKCDSRNITLYYSFNGGAFTSSQCIDFK